MTQPQEWAVWVFDSCCVLCDGGVQYTLKHEKAARIKFVSIQSETGRNLAVTHGIDPDDPDSFLFIENGVALEKSDALIALSRHLNGPARMVAWAEPLPKGLRDFVYGMIARHRYRLFGRKDSCIVPRPEHAHRFIL